MDGVIVCVRSTYFARLSEFSYTCHNGSGFGGLADCDSHTAAIAKTGMSIRRGRFMKHSSKPVNRAAQAPNDFNPPTKLICGSGVTFRSRRSSRKIHPQEAGFNRQEKE